MGFSNALTGLNDFNVYGPGYAYCELENPLPAGHYNPLYSGDYYPCQPGTAVTAYNARFCPSCVPGRYAAGSGWGSCQPCDAGYSCPDYGSISARHTVCPSGRYSLAGASGCTLCTSGRFQTAAASASCDACTWGLGALAPEWFQAPLPSCGGTAAPIAAPITAPIAAPIPAPINAPITAPIAPPPAHAHSLSRSASPHLFPSTPAPSHVYLFPAPPPPPVLPLRQAPWGATPAAAAHPRAWTAARGRTHRPWARRHAPTAPRARMRRPSASPRAPCVARVSRPPPAPAAVCAWRAASARPPRASPAPWGRSRTRSTRWVWEGRGVGRAGCCSFDSLFVAGACLNVFATCHFHGRHAPSAGKRLSPPPPLRSFCHAPLCRPARREEAPPAATPSTPASSVHVFVIDFECADVVLTVPTGKLHEQHRQHVVHPLPRGHLRSRRQYLRSVHSRKHRGLPRWVGCGLPLLAAVDFLRHRCGAWGAPSPFPLVLSSRPHACSRRVPSHRRCDVVCAVCCGPVRHRQPDPVPAVRRGFRRCVHPSLSRFVVTPFICQPPPSPLAPRADAAHHNTCMVCVPCRRCLRLGGACTHMPPSTHARTLATCRTEGGWGGDWGLDRAPCTHVTPPPHAHTHTRTLATPCAQPPQAAP